MSLSENIRCLSKKAGVALTIFRYVTLQTDGEYDTTGAGGLIDGIAGETVAVGKQFGMIVPDGGEAKVEAGAAVSVGDLLESDASGKAITASTGLGKGQGGRALSAAAADGDIITVEFRVAIDEVA